MGYDFRDATHVYVAMNNRNEGIEFFAYNEREPLNNGTLAQSSNPFKVYSLFKAINDSGSTLVMENPKDGLETNLDTKIL